MVNLYNRIMELCDQRGISGYKLCKDTHLSPSLLTDLKMGRRETLSAKNLSKVSDYLCVSVGYLLGLEDKDPLYEAAKDAVYQKEFMALTEAEKKAALSVVAFCKKNAPTLNFEDERIAKLLRLVVQLTPEQLDLLAALVSGSQPKQE